MTLPGAGLREYSVLKARVHEVLILGRQRIEREFTRMRYETGLLINEHVRLNEGRAAYGAKALLQLEKDSGVSYSELQRYAQFARAYPIVAGRRQLEFNLSWDAYRKLMTVPSEELRHKMILEAEQNAWPFEKIEARVRYAVGKDRDSKKAPRLPFVCLGPFFTYPIIRLENIQAPQGELLLDLGFKHRLEKTLFPRAKFREGLIVTASEDSLSITEAANANDQSLYTYKARVEEALDGDTFKLDFHLGLGQRQSETVRLNHIDCPELDTPEGKAAKRFVQNELSTCDFITVKSIKTRKEKWGRYLVDVFFERKGKLVYLNQLLLDKGHAVRMKM